MLAENIISKYPNSLELECVKYFTARIKGKPDKQKRQNNYLDALSQQSKIRIYYGNYQIKRIFDKNLNQWIEYPVEKMTDVNIATQLIIDAFYNRFDCAYIISGDSDLTPAINAVKSNFNNVRLVACFSPRRSSEEIKSICHNCYYIKEKLLKISLLPEKIVKSNGYEIKRPESWK